MKLKFAKLQGTGNDFVIINNLAGEFDRFRGTLPVKEAVKRICSRRTGVGADGLILVEDSTVADLSWRFYNADGSTAEMCGNGMRCFARFVYEEGLAPNEMRVETLAGVVEAFVYGPIVKVGLTKPRELALNLKVDGLTVHFINTGVPHAVIFVERADAVNVKEIGRKVRFHPLFAPAGTNVNFVEVRLDRIVVRTYERGVEDETLACGTGSVASALIAAKVFKLSSPVEVEVRSGERLKVHFDPKLSRVYLEGGTKWIYDGLLRREVLQ
ncbi:diaminopimelate epimerase [Thermovibrio ammonificans]|jgi:diaminopimelate epimerase|uniref:Diaminopimelate epimerase n=1 Tax=Thermovibrio ammonificans (strain DSM 15698 / JCM 12110 / HB-1) TaxID=648996 RepID=E8T397_THEA1|nr:diaminopimelate epimerase [Thermovibrio ammonificans]ADU97229.1 diaminopimelate epimerase [Thermovibrio ammonificans HB-1]